jgi:hypothetical protein
MAISQIPVQIIEKSLAQSRFLPFSEEIFSSSEIISYF